MDKAIGNDLWQVDLTKEIEAVHVEFYVLEDGMNLPPRKIAKQLNSWQVVIKQKPCHFLNHTDEVSRAIIHIFSLWLLSTIFRPNQAMSKMPI